MTNLEFAQKLLEKLTAYHHANRMKAEASAEISHIIKSTYEESIKKEEPIVTVESTEQANG